MPSKKNVTAPKMPLQVSLPGITTSKVPTIHEAALELASARASEKVAKAMVERAELKLLGLMMKKKIRQYRVENVHVEVSSPSPKLKLHTAPLDASEVS